MAGRLDTVRFFRVQALQVVVNWFYSLREITIPVAPHAERKPLRDHTSGAATRRWYGLGNSLQRRKRRRKQGGEGRRPVDGARLSRTSTQSPLRSMAWHGMAWPCGARGQACREHQALRRRKAKPVSARPAASMPTCDGSGTVETMLVMFALTIRDTLV